MQRRLQRPRPDDDWPRAAQRHSRAARARLNGMANCQIQRIFMPHGFSFYLAGQTLCDPSADYLQCRSAYFEACFGREYQAALSCWRNTAPGFPWSCMRRTIRSPARRPRAALKDFGCFYRAFARPSGRACTGAGAFVGADGFLARLESRLCDYLIPFSRREKALWNRRGVNCSALLGKMNLECRENSMPIAFWNTIAASSHRLRQT